MNHTYDTLEPWDHEPQAYERRTLLRVGDLIGPLRVEGVLGEGSMARVWSVRHLKLDVLRALKVMHATPDEWLTRFLREGNIQAHLIHSNILRVHDVLEVHGRPALLMDHADQGSLADMLQDQPLDAAFCRLMAQDLLSAMHIAHMAEVVHRDIKPSNILLCSTPLGVRAVLADFGIARKPYEVALTQTQGLLGTPAYMSPEQSKRPQDATNKADMFSFGVMLYHMLSGRLPFEGEDVRAQLNATAEGVYTPLHDVPDDLRQLVEACLAPAPQNRPDAELALAMIRQERQQLPVATPSRRSMVAIALVVLSSLAVAVVSFQINASTTKPLKGSHPRVDMRSQMHVAALERSAEHPEESLALMHAADALSEQTQQATLDPSLSRVLIGQGANARVIPAPDQVFKILSLPDGNAVAGVLINGDVVVWDVKTGEVRAHHRSTMGVMPRRVKMSPNGRWIALIPDLSRPDKQARASVRLVDLKTGKLVHTFSNGDSISDVFFAFHPSKPQAVMSSDNKFLTLWDLESGAPQNRIKLPILILNACAAYSPSGDRLLLIGGKGEGYFMDTSTARITPAWSVSERMFGCDLLWDASHPELVTLSTQRALVNMDVETGRVTHRTVAYTKNAPQIEGDALVLYGAAREAKLYDYPALTLRHRLRHDGQVRGVSVDRDAQQLVTASTDGAVRLWSTRTGALMQTLHGHGSWVLDVTSVQTEAGWQVWSAGRDHRVRAWSLPQPLRPPVLSSPKTLRWSASGRMMSLMDERQRLHVSEPEDSTRTTLLHQEAHSSAFRVVRWSESGRYLLESRDSGVYIHQFWPERKVIHVPEIVSFMHNGPFESVGAFLSLIGPELKLVRFSFDGEGSYTVEGKPYSRIMAHVSASADGQRVVATDFDHTMYFHDTEAWSAPATKAKTACVHPSTSAQGDASYEMIVGDWSGLIEVWDTRQGTLLRTMSGHTDGVTRVKHLRDGRILSSSRDHTLRLWNKDKSTVLRGHSGEVTAFAVDSSEELAVSVGRDNALVLWSLGEARQRMSVQLPRPMVDVWIEEGVVRTLDDLGAQWAWPFDVLTSLTRFDNVRVCRGTTDVVAVLPFGRDSVWAPDALCYTPSSPKDLSSSP